MANSDNPGARANHFLWLGPAIAVPGLISYFVFFSRWPAFRDTAWLNFVILAVALVVSLAGLQRAMASGGWRLFAGIASTVASGGLAALLVGYVFFLSNGLPSVEGVTAEGDAIPAVTLASFDGSPVNVAEVGADSTILVFYRGFW